MLKNSQTNFVEFIILSLARLPLRARGLFSWGERDLVLVFELGVNSADMLDPPAVEQDIVILPDVPRHGVQHLLDHRGVSSAELHQQGIHGFVLIDRYPDGVRPCLFPKATI